MKLPLLFLAVGATVCSSFFVAEGAAGPDEVSSNVANVYDLWDSVSQAMSDPPLSPHVDRLAILFGLNCNCYPPSSSVAHITSVMV